MTSNRNLGKVFVTGADGFIGSHLVESLLSLGNEVTALCCYNSVGTYGWLDHLAIETPKNLTLVLGDVRDQNMMSNLIKGHQTVFHLASLIAIPYSYRAPESYVDTNVKGALGIALACLNNNVERLIHTSTSEVYGTAKFVPISEEHPLQGQSPYSASKIGADMMIESFYRSFGLPVITLRPFNTYGPRQSLRAVIPTIIAQALKGDGTVRLGSLTPTRDFNYVADTVNAFLAVGHSSSETLLGQVFNAGSGEEITVGKTVELIGALLNKSLQVTAEGERVRPNASEVERLLCDNRKLVGATGWRPQVTLVSGLTKTIEWVQKHLPSINAEKFHV